MIFSGEQQPGELAPLFGVHLSDDFQDHFRGDFGAVRQILFFGYRSTTDVLRVEVGFELFCQFQTGLVLRVGVGIHQDSRGGVTCVALNGLDIAARFEQLVGGTGMTQTMEYDLLDRKSVV